MDGAGRGSDAYHHRGQTGKHRASRTHHRPFAYGDAGCDEDVGSHPGFILDHDGESLNVEAWAAVVVSSGAEIAFLRDDDIFAYGNFRESIKHGIVANPRMVADLQFPGIGNGDAGTDDHALADLRAEQAQQPAP